MFLFRKRANSRLADDDIRLVWQAVSVLLDYPTEATVRFALALGPQLDSLPSALGDPLRRFTERVVGSELGDLQRQFVETFDHTRRCCPYLTYYCYGDTRRRGIGLVEFKNAYKLAGLDLTEEELPDHICVVTAYGAQADLAGAMKFLTGYRPGVEMMRLALQDLDSAWADVAVALCATLPPLQGDEADAVIRLIEQGPPNEEVGVDGDPWDPRVGSTLQSQANNPAPADLGATIAVGAPR